MDSAVVYPHDTSSKTSSLKRTISKCSLTDGDALVYKTLSPMHAASVDDGSAPVLLPRRARAPGFADEPEVSPAVSSPDSYYDRILDECASPYDSPSAFGHCAESLTAARMFAALLDYLQDLAMCYASAMDQTFSELRQQLISTPFVVRQLQGIVQARLGLAWHLVNPLIELMQAFVSEVDFRDASVMELAEFVECCCGPAASSTLFPNGDVLVRLGEFYREVVAAFKRFLIKRWLQSGRITFPCEFGKKSDTLFLCMECHREHK